MLKRVLATTLGIAVSAVLGIAVVTAAPSPTEYVAQCGYWCMPDCYCVAPRSVPGI